MGLPARLVRSQLNFFKPFVANCSLEVTRKGQDKLGELMEAIHKKDVIVRDYSFERFEGAWLIPRDERRSGVILYLHGGGYTCGDLTTPRALARRWLMNAGLGYSAPPIAWPRKAPTRPRWRMPWRPTATCWRKAMRRSRLCCAGKAPEAGSFARCACG